MGFSSFAFNSFRPPRSWRKREKISGVRLLPSDANLRHFSSSESATGGDDFKCPSKREATGGKVEGCDSFRRMPTFGIFHRLNPPQAATISNAPQSGRQRAEKSRGGTAGKELPLRGSCHGSAVTEGVAVLQRYAVLENRDFAIIVRLALRPFAGGDGQQLFEKDLGCLLHVRALRENTGVEVDPITLLFG